MYEWLTWIAGGAATLLLQTIPNLAGGIGAAVALRAFRRRRGGR